MYHELIYDEKEKRTYPLGLQTSPEMNKILNNHAEWLDYNVSKIAGNRCRKDALEYAQHKDERQNWGKEKYGQIKPGEGSTWCTPRIRR